MIRGDIYWVDLNPTTGSEINKLRPCVLIGASAINAARHTVIVIPLSTSAKERPPLTISVSCDQKSVVAVCDQIRAVDKSRFRNKIGTLSIKEMESIEDGLRQVLCI